MQRSLNLKDLEQSWKMNLLSLSDALIQPRMGRWDFDILGGWVSTGQTTKINDFKVRGQQTLLYRLLTATQSSQSPPRSCRSRPLVRRRRSPASRRARRSRGRRGRACGPSSSERRSGERNSSLQHLFFPHAQRTLITANHTILHILPCDNKHLNFDRPCWRPFCRCVRTGQEFGLVFFWTGSLDYQREVYSMAKRKSFRPHESRNFQPNAGTARIQQSTAESFSGEAKHILEIHH